MNQISNNKKKNGGARPGAGRKKGSVTQKTLDMQAALKRYRERANRIGDALFESKVTEALGYHKMVRIELGKKNKKTGTITKTKELYTVTDPEEFDHLLATGVLDVDYMLVVAAHPNYKAAESIENRSWGKPTETVQHEGSDGGPLRIIIDR